MADVTIDFEAATIEIDNVATEITVETGFPSTTNIMRKTVYDPSGVAEAILNPVTKTSAYTVVATDNDRVIECTNGPWTLSLTAAATLGDGFAVTVHNHGTTRGVYIDPNGSETVDGATGIWLYPGQTCHLHCDGSNWITDGLNRRKLIGNETIYVDPSNGASTNDGLAAGSGGALATMQQAWNLGVLFDLNGYVLTIQLADDTYTDGLIANRHMHGGTVVVNGNSGTPSNVVVSTTSANAIQATAGVKLTVQNFQVETTTAGSGLISDSSSEIDVGAGMIFGACATAHMVAQNYGLIVISNAYSITGVAAYHFYATGGTISFSGLSNTASGTLAFTVFAVATTIGSILGPSSTWTGGTLTGARYACQLNGVINTQGGGASYFPGDSSGSTATGGQYA